MTDLEINKALALAIGWTENRIDKDGTPDPDVVTFHYSDMDVVKCWDGNDWRTFDYTDWNVIGPIAARYDCFPYCGTGGWIAGAFCGLADTPQKAIALAVIEGAKK